MNRTTAEARRKFESLDRPSLERYQLDRLNQWFSRVLPLNSFYVHKLTGCRTSLDTIEQLHELPFTTKDELAGTNGQRWAANRTYPLEQYARVHRTSGTQSHPILVLDTQEDWDWWAETWQYVLDAAEADAHDRAAMAFSFGPFIGFWSAHEALVRRECMTVPCGGLSSLARLELILATEATLLFCTPSYALHLADVAHKHQIPIRESAVRAIIVAGEPGGSVEAIRQRITDAWGSDLVDHAGATEVGPWGYANHARTGLHIVESEFIAEFVSLKTGEIAEEGELSELVLTNLGRFGAPLLRYRTGDLVRYSHQVEGENVFRFLPGGVLGRVDDMMVIRGVNVYPSAIEQILRSFSDVVEYRLTARRDGAMDALQIEVECREHPETTVKQLATAIHARLGLRVDVHGVDSGNLPRFEHKGGRFIDQRHEVLPDEPEIG